MVNRVRRAKRIGGGVVKTRVEAPNRQGALFFGRQKEQGRAGGGDPRKHWLPGGWAASQGDGQLRGGDKHW